MRVATLLLPALVLSAGFSGCIASKPFDVGEAFAAADVPEGTMDAQESLAGSACRGRTQHPCAARDVRASGAMNLDRIEVALDAITGVTVRAGPEGAWSLVAHLEAEGASDAEARANLDRLVFAWTHEERGRHVVHAEASRPRGADWQARASFEVTLPPSVIVTLSAETAAGGVRVEGLRTDGLSARTASGGVEIDAEVTSVEARAASGGVEARLVPVGSGRIHLETASGGVKLLLPEDARHGYDVDAKAASGGVSIGLRDGDAQGDRRQMTFRTSGFEERAVQSFVVAQTASGGADVGPS